MESVVKDEVDMKVDNISRLFQALSQSPNSVKPEPQAETPSTQATSKGSHAVSLAPNLSANADEVSRSEREERVAKLKAKVESGTYKPDTQAVAQAVVRELFA